MRHDPAPFGPYQPLDWAGSLPGARVIDQSERTLLVEVPDGELRSLMPNLSRWILGEERSIPLPDSRPRPV